MSIRGTIAQLAPSLTVNGNAVTAPELSILFKLGNGTFATVVDTVKIAGQRGKPANVWELSESGAVAFATVSPTVATALSDDPANVDDTPPSYFII